MTIAMEMVVIISTCGWARTRTRSWQHDDNGRSANAACLNMGWKRDESGKQLHVKVVAHMHYRTGFSSGFGNIALCGILHHQS